MKGKLVATRKDSPKLHLLNAGRMKAGIAPGNLSGRARQFVGPSRHDGAIHTTGRDMIVP